MVAGCANAPLTTPPMFTAGRRPGSLFPATVYLEAQAARGQVLRDFCDQVFAQADALLLPSITMPVPSIAETDEGQPGAIQTMVAGITRATRPFNYLGLPGLANAAWRILQRIAFILPANRPPRSKNAPFCRSAMAMSKPLNQHWCGTGSTGLN